MKYINIKQPGGSEMLEIAEMQTPSPTDRQVLIKVEAAGVNRPDVFQRQGNYPPPPGASNIPGLEIAGEIVSLGEDVGTVSIGDRVCALVTGGGYAEYAIADASLCLPIPKGLSVIEAASLPETYFTVWSNVFDRAKLQAGETLLVNGGSSGIGTTAIQMAKAFAARVFTTAGTEDKCLACRDLGADLAINYRTSDFVSECKAATNNKGMDVVLDMVIGDYMDRNIDVAAIEGRIILIAGLNGYTTKVNMLPVMLKRLIITGSTLRARSVEFKAEIANKLKTRIWPLLGTGDIKPVVHTVLPLEQASEAHRLMETSEHIGKIILTM